MKNWSNTNHISKYQTAACLKKKPNITTHCLSSHQAQSRVQESSQKLDLLRLSLDKCLKEKSQEPPEQPDEEVDSSLGPPKSPLNPRPGCLLSTSPSIFSIRPASLTGITKRLCCFLKKHQTEHVFKMCTEMEFFYAMSFQAILKKSVLVRTKATLILKMCSIWIKYNIVSQISA